MLHLALRPAAQYGFSSLNDYQFVSQGILCLVPLLYSIFNGHCGEFLL
jgi:hypothetical protein